MPENLELVREGPLVGERALVVLALVGGLPPRQSSGARDPGARADVAEDRDLVRATPRLGRERPRHSPLERPARLGAPGSVELGQVGLGSRGAPDEDADRRLVLDAVFLVAEPAAEPSDELG